MKSTKVLAVLAGTALLTACSQEELFEVNNAPQQMEEVVGAKLAGADISMNVSIDGSSAQSRYAGGELGWGNSDVVGLGWILNGDISSTQSEKKYPDASALYANHMFGIENAEEEIWSTKGNLYEGWYFAYYPWSYEAKAGKIKKYEMNPKMLDRGVTYHQSQSLYLSNNQFISEGDIDKKTNSLTDNIKLYQAVKFIQITAKAQEESTFAKGGDLSDLQIDKVTISAGEKNIFADKVNIYAKNLPAKIEYSEEETEAETDKKNLAAFRNAYSDVVTATKVSTISRDVTEADLLVSTNPTTEGKNVNVYLNVLPTTNDNLTVKDITVTFHSGTASFVIAYDENISEANKAAFEALAAAYHKDGVLSTINEVDENGDPKKDLTPLKLTFELCAEDFATDFSSITTIDEWNDAVTLVQRLKRSEAEFCIDGNIEFDGKINMPESCALTVIPATDENADETETLADNVITLKGTFEAGIPAGLNIENVDVYVEGTVKEAQTIVANSVNNDGTLVLGKGTNVEEQMVLATKVINNNVIEMSEYSMITNVDNKGRINIVYKSAVELAENGENGEIVYEVTELDTPTRIQNVLRTSGNNQERHAQVNVLVFDSVNKISEFDLTYNTNDEGEDDYYHSTLEPGQSGVTYQGLENVSLEINGVNVSSTKDVTVKNVEINNAKLGAGIAVNGDLTVKGGNVVAKIDKVKGVLTIESGQGEINAETIGSVNITSGNFTVNAETIEGNVVATGENYFNVKNFNGGVTLTNTSSNAICIEGATFKENVTLNGDYGLVNIALPKDLTIKGGNVKMHNVNISGTLTNDGKVTISGNDNIVIKKIVNNKELATSTTIYVEEIILKKEVSKTNVQENPEKIIYYSEYYGQGGNTTGKILPSTIRVVDNEWQINNAEGLKAFAALVNAGTSFEGKTIKLVEDIDLANTPWTGIGNENAPFNGVFDGDNKTISNLFIENTERNGVGLISQAKGTKAHSVILKNLTLKNVTLKGKNDVGALLGSTGNYVSIENVKLTGDVKIEGQMNVGGLVGETCKTISNVTVNVNEGSFVKSNYGPVGGVAGLLVENNHASDINSNINVFATFVSEQYSGNNGAGGIFGCTNGYGSTVKNCTSSGNVTVENIGTDALQKRIGGISGRVHGGKITFTNCTFSGTLKSTYEGTEVTDFSYNGLVGENTATVTIN